MDENNADEIQICQNVEPHEDEDNVKSKAVVKFAVARAPAKFNRLECNTNLNLPPSNWLSNSASSYGLQQSIYHSAGFASFRMAHMFSDCLGEVDVVSDAENIKKLLKLPYYSKGAISMMVHRIENTLLIDEFDIQKYLLRKDDDDWQWLRTFICENIRRNFDANKGRNFGIKNKSRGALKKMNLLSKFLHHSLLPNSNNSAESNSMTSSSSGETDAAAEVLLKNLETEMRRQPLQLTGPLLPEPSLEENVPDPKTKHVFNRNVVWTFEDIRMLIGTDMPIFGGGTRPCISLRLRNMAEPINVLTGIDYWLDNLMCNVPEVVMCYHIDGIVQKYELIKTEDLPFLEDSHFSPQLIRNVAQNILAFLKANATKAGHTYWLFKGKNDDVVKLYDLSTLCRKEDCDRKDENPFTIPVAMLLYTVARNMKNTSKKISAGKAGSIKMLLTNCIKLLTKEKNPEIVTSSHYILSDLYIPAGIDPKAPDLDSNGPDSDIQSVYDDDFLESDFCDAQDERKAFFSDDDDDDDDADNSDHIAVRNLCDTLKEFNLNDNWKNNRSPSPLIGSVEERCRCALHHIYEGISCLKYFSSSEDELAKNKMDFEKEEELKKIRHEEQNPIMAKSFQPIPLPYEPLKSEPKATNPDQPIPMGWSEDESLLTRAKKKQKAKKSKRNSSELATIPEGKQVKHEDSKIVTQQDLTKPLSSSWDIHLKLLLLEKGSLTFATLAEHYYSMEAYGSALRHIYLAIKCQQVVGGYLSPLKSQKGCLLGRAGDCFFQITKSSGCIDEYKRQFEEQNENDLKFLSEIEKDLTDQEDEILPSFEANLEQLLLKSCTCYNLALQTTDNSTRLEIIRRLGSVQNELGVKYMHWGQNEYNIYLDKKNSKPADVIPLDDKLPDMMTTDPPHTVPLYEILMKKSYDCLARGISAFLHVKDNANLSLLYLNMGRFLRLRGHVHVGNEKEEDQRRQKEYYYDAVGYYQRALHVLNSRDNNAELWDLANWELSSAVFAFARDVQDSSDVNLFSESEIEKETLELLQKALSLCDLKSNGHHQISYMYRAGLINNRLGSYYHFLLRKLSDESKRKIYLQLCDNYYTKAASMFETLKEVKDYLKTQLERNALQEFQAQDCKAHQKLKYYQTSLEILLESFEMLKYLHSQTEFSEEDLSDLLKQLQRFESRLQFILLNLTKASNSTRNKKKEQNNNSKLTNLYKQMYSLTLRTKDLENVEDFVEHLVGVLGKLKDVLKGSK